VFVREQQLAAVLVVGVDDVDVRVARVGEREELDLLVDDELGGEELVDEGDVVVERAHLEDLLAAEAERGVPVALLVEIVAVLPLLAERPLFQRSSMSR
jgi:hypothetical protein